MLSIARVIVGLTRFLPDMSDPVTAQLAADVAQMRLDIANIKQSLVTLPAVMEGFDRRLESAAAVERRILELFTDEQLRSALPAVLAGVSKLVEWHDDQKAIVTAQDRRLIEIEATTAATPAAVSELRTIFLEHDRHVKARDGSIRGAVRRLSVSHVVQTIVLAIVVFVLFSLLQRLGQSSAMLFW